MTAWHEYKNKLNGTRSQDSPNLNVETPPTNSADAREVHKASNINKISIYEQEIQTPFVISNIFDDVYFNALQKYAMNLWANDDGSAFSESFGRYQWSNTEMLNKGSELLLPMAKEKFKSNTLKPSWNLLVTYQTPKAKLWKHKDDNACTYTIDYCLFQKTPWDLLVENKPYSLNENQALFMYGCDQEHWREEFPSPETNLISYVFYFFCEPDHWYFTKGPSYLDTVIRAKKQ